MCYRFLILFTFIGLLHSCQNKNEQNYIGNAHNGSAIDWSKTKAYYLTAINKSICFLDTLETEKPNSKTAKLLFIQARQEFKKSEAYASYLNPEVGHRANGPALAVFLEDNDRVLEPVGFQKIEESIFEGDVSLETFRTEIQVTKGMLNILKRNIEKRNLNPQRFFVATHQQLLRILSFSLSGFDTPVSQLGLQEARLSLQSLKTVYQLSLSALIQQTNSHLENNFFNHIQAAQIYLDRNTDFNSFNRFVFIKTYLNPIIKDWVNIRKAADIWSPVDYLPFNFDSPTFFETNSFNTNYFLPTTIKNATEEEIALGRKLFFDPNLSKSKNMSCATCHKPSKAFTDGMTRSIDNNGNFQLRNTPTLINSVYQQNFFWDGRSPTIQDQVSSVFTNKLEFNSSLHQFSDAILKDSSYIKLFKDAYGDIPTKNIKIVNAIAAYIATLNGMDSKFDKNIRGELNTMTKDEIFGFNLFMGKALCATCHFIPHTNGTVPPFYTETEKEVIGVPKTADNKNLDTDTGFYWKFNNPIHKGMFKTPTVRNSALTAPYMHNGVYNTLEDVINFYNLGGGGGIGFNLPHQTLPFDELSLTKEEQNALVAFLKTLNSVPDTR